MPLALLFLLSCKPDSNSTVSFVSYHSNSANFCIVNLSSGITVHNSGMVTNVGLDTVWSAHNIINAHHDDVLKLIYQPPQMFEQDGFLVTFTAFEKIFNITSKPYETEFVVNHEVNFGEYLIKCDAISDSWASGSSDNGIIKVIVIN